ncbi:metallophosphoesterase family protein [Paenibacillus chungangensis]|uniref:Metallophosphoesterase family protein n=1 Tax=Paenibacillus chungangensis TaxID=696535 RepID=A0ABW3HU81_9BACL
MVTFLNLSDLHIQSKKIEDIRIVLNALFEDIEKQNCKIDFILFNGDLINNGSQGLTGDKEFELAVNEFINPLLRVTGLSYNEFFIVPGNHDINRLKISEFIDLDITSKFNDRDRLNKFIDNIGSVDNKLLLRRLEDYNEFVEGLYPGKSPYTVRSNPLFSTYIIKIGEYKIGIACLNSSWGAYGGSSDINQLLIGVRQIDLAARDLADCHLKIAMFHHPLDWLKEFDREAIKDILFVNFNMVFNGHLHVQNQQMIVTEQFKTIMYRCGSLFENRLFNGYAITHVNMNTSEADIYLREYYDT